MATSKKSKSLKATSMNASIKDLQSYIQELDRANKEHIEKMHQHTMEMAAAVIKAIKGEDTKEPEVSIPEVVEVPGEDFVKLMQAIKEVADISTAIASMIK